MKTTRIVERNGISYPCPECGEWVKFRKITEEIITKNYYEIKHQCCPKCNAMFTMNISIAPYTGVK